MKVYILICLLAFASARPEVGPYNYNPPLNPIGGHAAPCCQQLALLKSNVGHTAVGGGLISGRVVNQPLPNVNYGAPFAAQHSGFGAVNSFGAGGTIGGGFNNGFNFGKTGFNGLNVVKNGFSGGQFGVSSGSNFGGLTSGFTSGPITNSVSGPIAAPISAPISGPILNGGGLSSGSGFSSGLSAGAFSSQLLPAQGGGASFDSVGFNGAANTANAGTALVQKHIYVHVPPHDNEDQIKTIHHSVAPGLARKHYKIIFIKAPNPPSYQHVAALSGGGLTEEKTLVYVLVKKPDEPSIQEIQAAHNSVHLNKPEVYFIKYKTKNGNDLQANLGVSGAGVTAGGAFNDGSFAIGGPLGGNNGLAASSHAGGVANSYIPPPSPSLAPVSPSHSPVVAHTKYGPPPVNK